MTQNGPDGATAPGAAVVGISPNPWLLQARASNRSIATRIGKTLWRSLNAFTAALNWYLTGNVKLMFNYIRFEGQNSPLVVAPVSLNGTTAKGDAFAALYQLAHTIGSIKLADGRILNPATPPCAPGRT